jgi:hypothetical protein
VQNEGLACPHERKRHTEGNLGSFKKPRPTKPPNRNKDKKKRGRGLVLPTNYGRID